MRRIGPIAVAATALSAPIVAWCSAGTPANDIRDVSADLTTPSMEEGEPSAGRRVRHVLRL